MYDNLHVPVRDRVDSVSNAPAPQPTEWPHPMTPRTVVPESADKTPRPYHGPMKPEPVQIPVSVRLNMAIAPTSEEKWAVLHEWAKTMPSNGTVSLDEILEVCSDCAPAPQPEPEESPELAQAVEQGEQRCCATCLDLAMFVRRLCRRVLKKSCTEEDDVVKAAQDFLKRKGLEGNLLRDHFTEGQPAPTQPELPEMIERVHDVELEPWDIRFIAVNEAHAFRDAALREIQQLREQLAQIRGAKIPTIGYVWVHGVQMQGEITAVPRWMALKPDVKKALASATQTIAALRLDNAQLVHDVAEWSTIANLGNDRIAAAKAVGVVFADPGTTCVNRRAEDAEAKVRGLSARFMCQAELDRARVAELQGGKMETGEDYRSAGGMLPNPDASSGMCQGNLHDTHSSISSWCSKLF